MEGRGPALKQVYRAVEDEYRDGTESISQSIMQLCTFARDLALEAVDKCHGGFGHGWVYGSGACMPLTVTARSHIFVRPLAVDRLARRLSLLKAKVPNPLKE